VEGAGSGERLQADGAVRRRALWELAVGYGLILAVVWTKGLLQIVLFWASMVWIMLTSGLSGVNWRQMGLGLTGLRRSVWVPVAALALAAAAMAVAARLHTLHAPSGPSAFARRFWFYCISALMQQFLLQDFVLLRMLRIVTDYRKALAVSAVLFAAAHLPNPVLTPATLLWGAAACWLFLRYRNLYTLGVAHALLGICIAVAVPGAVSHNMRVGLGYVVYRPGLRGRVLGHL
jgi:hypothetical protein